MFVGLEAVDGFADFGVDVLHAHGGAVDAEVSKCGDVFFGEGAGVEFGG